MVRDIVRSSLFWILQSSPLQWRHNERNGVSNHLHLDCLFNRLFRLTKKDTKAPCHWLYDGNPPVTAIHNCLRFRPLEFRELSHWRQQYVVIWMDDVCPLQWHHNGREGVSNHQPHGCLLNRISRRRSKKKSKLRVTGLCEGNSPVSGEFPAQMANYTENVAVLRTSSC